MQGHFSDNATVDFMLKKADDFMASGRWSESESVLRECCTDQADFNLRLAQLHWRRQCAEYASGLDWDALGEDGVKQALTDNYDGFVAHWVMNEYKG